MVGAEISFPSKKELCTRVVQRRRRPPVLWGEHGGSPSLDGRAEARQGGGETGTGCPSMGRDGGGHLHRRTQDGSGVRWVSPPGPGPRWAGSPLRHRSPMTPFIGPVPALLYNGVTREALKSPASQVAPQSNSVSVQGGSHRTPVCSKGPAPAPTAVCCRVLPCPREGFLSGCWLGCPRGGADLG